MLARDEVLAEKLESHPARSARSSSPVVSVQSKVDRGTKSQIGGAPQSVGGDEIASDWTKSPSL